MYLCTRNYDLKRGGTFETAKAGTFHSVTAGTLIPLSSQYALANPPDGIADELETSRIVESFNGSH